MLMCLGLIFMTQWMLLVAQMYDDWQCTNWEISDSPIQNLSLNWWKTELSWIDTMNLTEYECSVTVDSNEVTIQVKNTNCIFGRNLALPLHTGASFSVTAESTDNTYSVTCKYIPQGISGSAIENFSCVIYNISFMNCTWQAGRNAPRDTQYFLYWQNSEGDDTMECELYIKDENGRHMGCRFKNVKIEKAYFLVNGSSKNSLIQFYDKYIELYTIEKLMPPSNVTVNCDKTLDSCTIQWQRPQINHSNKDKCFKYEVQITSKDNSAEWTKKSSIKEISTSHIVQNPNMRKKNLVKIRAAGHGCLVKEDWGEWSAAVEFGNEETFSSSVWILPVLTVATLSVAIFTIFFCRRTGYWKATFPQIPKPKNPFHGQPDVNPEMMECKMQSVISETEQIAVVTEVVK
ncbi:granulocyte-macrophage colony-stimulating factor receptor subunit alpha-like isoform X1 [Cyrtonyx montezumae]|uniref:granulocyte-macrophage colony-stimulating factor receptor subunit alpha-like isoform X1 n=1 Tax=Cyrtonyx montezumae TaxID=9017 RepID=UPI0032DAB254